MSEAPELIVSEWLNTDKPVTLASLRGRVVLVEAFQMLCPGCVSHSLPQAKKVAAHFRPDQVAVIGLHTVFEHHAVQGTREALQAFLHEYRIAFPVAIDQPAGKSRIPMTMAAYAMEGTPTMLLIDAEGLLRRQFFGREDDMVLGARIMELVAERDETINAAPPKVGKSTACDDDSCPR